MEPKNLAAPPRPTTCGSLTTAQCPPFGVARSQSASPRPPACNLFPGTTSSAPSELCRRLNFAIILLDLTILSTINPTYGDRSNPTSPSDRCHPSFTPRITYTAPSAPRRVALRRHDALRAELAPDQSERDRNWSHPNLHFCPASRWSRWTTSRPCCRQGLGKHHGPGVPIRERNPSQSLACRRPRRANTPSHSAGRDYDRSYDRSHDRRDDRRDEYSSRPWLDNEPRRPDERSSRSSAGLARHPKRPPPPSVEDETESLAKEHTPSIAPSSSSEGEPQNRGDIDQQPILVPIDEYEAAVLDQNPERRFVLVSGVEPDAEKTDEELTDDRRFVLVSGTGADAEKTDEKPGGHRRPSPAKPRRDDRNGNARAEISEDDDKVPRRRPDSSRRKSRQDLPPLETDFQQEEPPIRRSNSRRNRERPIVDQEPPRSARPVDDVFLSPSPVVHTAGGRERAYLDINAGLSRSPGGARGPREIPKSTRPEGRRSTYSSTSSSAPRRLSSSASGARPLIDPKPSSRHGYGGEDAMAFMRSGAEVSSRNRSSVSPTKTRKSSSPPYPSSSRDRPSERPMGQRSRRESDAREHADYYGSTGRSNRSDRPAPRRTVEPETLLSPENSRPIAIGRSGPKGPSPLPSPRASQGGQFSDASSFPNSRSSTLPVSLDRRKPDEYFPPPSSTISASPPRRADDGDRGPRPRAPSRSSSAANSGFAIPPLAAGVLAAGAVAAGSLGRGHTAERRNPDIVHEEDGESGSPAKYWQPGPFDPETQGVHLDRPVVSWRRYSEDVQQGNLPQLPECRWTVPSIPRGGAGGPLFLTLPRASNFTICPDCFSGVFAKRPEFVQKFTPAPVRSPDQPISCDFGLSPWYRIAYLMTLKYHLPDLRLLENVAAVAARHQDCPGARPATRMWYSMTDPRSQRPISSFVICSCCAHMVAALLPNLPGIFTPLDPHASPTKGMCDLHFAPERKRFLDYFDVLEMASDRARNRGVPDIQDIANQLRDISLVEECYRNTPLQSAKWYVSSIAPDIAVAFNPSTECL